MEFKEVIQKRRAVNFFDTQRDVSPKLIREMVEMAALTPSSFNLQPWSLMILRDPGEKKRLMELAMKQPKVTEAPVVMMILADRDAWKKGHAFVERNLDEMIRAGAMDESGKDWFYNAASDLYGANMEKTQAFAVKNASFFGMSLMLAAKSLGLDTHPMDGFDHDGVLKEFHIPENYWVPLLLSVGYFDESKDLAPPKWRKTFDEIVVTFS